MTDDTVLAHNGHKVAGCTGKWIDITAHVDRHRKVKCSECRAVVDPRLLETMEMEREARASRNEAQAWNEFMNPRPSRLAVVAAVFAVMAAIAAVVSLVIQIVK